MAPVAKTLNEVQFRQILSHWLLYKKVLQYWSQSAAKWGNRIWPIPTNSPSLTESFKKSTKCQMRAFYNPVEQLMSLTNFRVAWLCYNEIKHSDWSKIVMGLGTANQSSLFQHSMATLLWNLLMTLALQKKCINFVHTSFKHYDCLKIQRTS